MINDCMFCFARSVEKLYRELNIDEDLKRGITRKSFGMISQASDEVMPVELARDLHAMIRKELGNPDPYHAIKHKCNQELLEKYDEFKNLINHSDFPFETALKLAIAGNIIDYGAAHDHFNVDETIHNVLNADFGINNSGILHEKLQKAKTVLYLGDNAGEIVMDKLFIEQLGHPNLYYATRGGVILNDITMIDAIETGMDKVANVISNGYDAPSTILEKTSSEFQQLFREADVIISKGQGNLEGLMNNPEDKIFFALMVKCKHVANILGTTKGNYVVKQNCKAVRV